MNLSCHGKPRERILLSVLGRRRLSKHSFLKTGQNHKVWTSDFSLLHPTKFCTQKLWQMVVAYCRRKNQSIYTAAAGEAVRFFAMADHEVAKEYDIKEDVWKMTVQNSHHLWQQRSLSQQISVMVDSSASMPPSSFAHWLSRQMGRLFCSASSNGLACSLLLNAFQIDAA